ncbi:bifunctional DNA primase/polymerase [Solirubrobacter sp. CPCC 204708]|uniref:Bifunctional DNA primase/polymerase n=1 Tax=Solirubrobacter deserti TaxID=2282478 RepID=A0ABT4RLH4_9ACTN|nr:bifunctional DNA primase/polymerase [Solirubrobacter deserti]MBE2320384.1 bifunctional DNA primase/polymerase [Solirubrobacter deserti]MDA0139421.1 bifunctional DNA primase/polymerase [Solirubrobacter deserti]
MPTPDPHSPPVAGTSSPLLAALAYAAAGWPVLPVHAPTATGGCSCGRVGCRAIGKHARVRAWPRRATTDVRVIAAWWRRWPDANVGVHTGTIVVLDVDGPDGARALLDLQAAHAPLPPTRCAITARGAHLYFCADTHLLDCSAAQLGPGLDVRARGGYVIAPPSRHATGHLYRWANTHALAPLPPWLAELLAGSAPDEPARAVLPPAIARSGDRRARYLQAALDGECAAVARAPTGTRNATLNRAAFRLGQLVGAGLGEPSLIADALGTAARQSGLGPTEADATIASGLAAGRAHPRPLADVA